VINGVLLWTRKWTSTKFHKRRGISWLAERLLASEEGFCSVELISYLFLDVFRNKERTKRLLPFYISCSCFIWTVIYIKRYSYKMLYFKWTLDLQFYWTTFLHLFACKINIKRQRPTVWPPPSWSMNFFSDPEAFPQVIERNTEICYAVARWKYYGTCPRNYYFRVF